MYRFEAVQEIIDRTGALTYLEIGVNRGRSFRKIRAARKVGVDPKLRIPAPARWFMAGELFELTSDDFFAQRAGAVFADGQPDVAFIDGMHTHSQTMRDVTNVLNHLSEGGSIVLHDCSPTCREMALPDPPTSGGKVPWTGDVWKTVVLLRATRPDLEIQVFDFDYGVGVIRRASQEQQTLAMSPEEVRELDYAALNRDRRRLLNLKPESDFGPFARSLQR